ncbi:MAG: HEAT repeat domain-containing protein [Candidatus Margulisbacteria bacterium]|nr:HEAT repeat domain-containing protein [Candidatus Margulisiibacteriota bacterium]
MSSDYNIIAHVQQKYPKLYADGWVDFNRDGRKDRREKLRDVDGDGYLHGEMDYFSWVGANSKNIDAAIWKASVESNVKDSRDKDPRVRQKAIKALDKLNCVRSRNALSYLIFREKIPGIRIEAARSFMENGYDEQILINTTGDETQNMVNDFLSYSADLADQKKSKTAREFLVWLDGAIIKHLKNALNFDDEFYKMFADRVEKAEHCGSNGRVACGLVAGRFEQIRRIRLEALHIIEKIEGKRAFLLFTEVLGSFDRLREIGARFIGKYGMSGRVDNAFLKRVRANLATLAREDKSPSVRWEAMMALCKLNDRAAINMLLSGLNSRDFALRLKTIRALAEMRYKPANKALKRIVGDTGETNLIVVEALKALVKTGDRSIIPMLVAFLNDGRKSESLECFLKDGEPRKVLDDMTGDDVFAFQDEETLHCTVAEIALDGLMNFGIDSVPLLIELVRNDESEDTRKKAVDVLINAGSKTVPLLKGYLAAGTRPVQLRWLAEDVLDGLGIARKK